MQSQIERLDLIRQKLDERKTISTREIMKLCHVSFDTARRDVIKLTSTGQAIRIHGGLMKIKQGTVPDYNSRDVYKRQNLGSGHGHAELGHIDLVINGKDILVDPGRYTYVDGIERRYLKGATAHNTIMLNDTPFSKPKNSWKYEYVSTPINLSLIHI